MVVICRQHGAEPGRESFGARGDDDTGLPAHRKLASDARTTDRSEIESEALAPLHLTLHEIRQGEDRIVLGHQALGDHHHRHRLLQRFGQPVDRPADAGRADAEDEEVGVVAKRRAELAMGEGFYAVRQFNVQARMPARLTDTVDDRLVEMRADEPDVMTVVAGRQDHRRSHHASTQYRDDRHFLRRHPGESRDPLNKSAREVLPAWREFGGSRLSPG